MQLFIHDINRCSRLSFLKLPMLKKNDKYGSQRRIIPYLKIFTLNIFECLIDGQDYVSWDTAL